jgi:L-seryl-tRNA(Ser) seleniumtransferase
MDNPLRHLPSVSQLLEHPRLKRLGESLNQQVVVDGVRSFLGQLRSRVTSSLEAVDIPAPADLAEKIASWLTSARQSRLRPVINGTGILLHTGLGRAPLAPAAIEAIRQVAGGYCSVELDLATGQRGQRADVVRQQLADLTGCEAAAIANNNAAATMLALSSLARGKEVIVSRGELVEIGGSYRLPEVMECSGCVLREVGTTNKTRVSDYENAINDRTGAILRVHTSNYRVVGFTAAPTRKELVAVAHRRGIPLIDDIGSGAMFDPARYGLQDEPLARDSVSEGADLTLFSGDKLLGGPQCGIIIGRQKYVGLVLANPLMRAMRVGKLTLAALTATLALHSNPAGAEVELPLLTMLAMPRANLELRAKRIAGQLNAIGPVETAEAVESFSMLGGGSVPGQEIPTWCVSLAPRSQSVDQFATRLRDHEPAVMGRIQRDRLLLDMRTVNPAQDVDLVTAVESLK